jgi:hypothetical protein
LGWTPKGFLHQNQVCKHRNCPASFFKNQDPQTNNVLHTSSKVPT